jgi:hypothetical protein
METHSECDFAIEEFRGIAWFSCKLRSSWKRTLVENIRNIRRGPKKMYVQEKPR